MSNLNSSPFISSKDFFEEDLEFKNPRKLSAFNMNLFKLGPARLSPPKPNQSPKPLLCRTKRKILNDDFFEEFKLGPRAPAFGLNSPSERRSLANGFYKRCKSAHINFNDLDKERLFPLKPRLGSRVLFFNDSPPSSPSLPPRPNTSKPVLMSDSEVFSERPTEAKATIISKFSSSGTCLAKQSVPANPSYLPFEYIEADAARSFIDGGYKSAYDELFVLDCRFPYEFEGGHIESAINIPSVEILEELFFKSPKKNKKTMIIFHCEFSIKRGPSFAKHFRNCDRKVNLENYPDLYYPDIFVIKGGYSTFFKNHKELCNPPNYVTMNDCNYKNECSALYSSFERQFKRSKSASLSSITRASSFSFYNSKCL
ncbi:hypothetical protein BB560_003610 [Smittium megazygosporum]|uniref:M-phase inducer phosphatase n=1 Tax=Smittium megazygosporum TaxID=133381 RepID=A0A2T9ZBL3_9FUNG|nr:hypothetical protein BB560_003610 [Smittium megazygosporum]